MPLCTVCKVEFPSSEEFRTHFGSSWHKFNVKRADNGKAVLSRERFAQMQALAGQSKFQAKKADHIKPKEEQAEREKKARVPKHTDLGRDYDLTYSLFDDRTFATMQDTLAYMERVYRFTFPRGIPHNLEFKGRQFWTVRDMRESDEEEEEVEDKEEEVEDEEHCSASCCCEALLCQKHCSTTTTTKMPVPIDATNAEGADGEEMDSEDESDDDFERIPIVANGKNVKVNGKYALLFYLGSIIWRDNACIYCDRHFTDPVATQKHMAACSHQKMDVAHILGDGVQDFYDWPQWLEWLTTKYFASDVGTAAKEANPEAEPTIEEMVQTVGYYHAEDGEHLIVGGTKVLSSRKNIKQINSRPLSENSLALAREVTERRRKVHAIGLGDEADAKHRKEQAMLVQRNKIQKHDYGVQFRTHRIKHIVNMQINYMMNNTGH